MRDQEFDGGNLERSVMYVGKILHTGNNLDYIEGIESDRWNVLDLGLKRGSLIFLLKNACSILGRLGKIIQGRKSLRYANTEIEIAIFLNGQKVNSIGIQYN